MDDDVDLLNTLVRRLGRIGYTCPTDSPEGEAFNMFPVVDARGVLRGLMTKLDLLRTFRPQMRRWILDLKLLWAERIENLMSRGSVSVEADDPITVAVDTMIEARLRSLPVVQRRAEGPVLVGIVSRTDVLPCLTLEHDDAA